MLNKDIENLQNVADSNIKQVVAQIAQKIDMNYDTLQNMDRASTEVSKLNQDVATQAPVAKAKAIELLDKVKEALQEVKESVNVAQEKLQNTIAQNADKATNDVNTEANEVRKTLSDDQHAFQEQVSRDLAQTQTVGTEVKREVEQNAEDSSEHLKETRQELAGFSSEIANLVDTTASSMMQENAEANDFKNDLASKARQATREGEQLSAQLRTEAATRFNSRLTAAEQTMAMTEEKQEKALQIQLHSAQADLEQMAVATAKYMRDKESELDRIEKSKDEITG